MPYQPSDTAIPFADFGVPVVVDGGVTTSGWLKAAVQVERELGVQLPSTATVLTVAAGSLGTLAPDQRITVDGVAYRYRGAVAAEADRFQRVALMKVAP